MKFGDEGATDAAVRAVLAAGGKVVSVTPNRETLEDFFLRRLGEGASSPAAAAAEHRGVRDGAAPDAAT